MSADEMASGGDDAIYSLDNQRKALVFLHDAIAYATTAKLAQPSHLQEVLLASSVYTLTPKAAPQRLNLLLFLANRFDKAIEEIVQLYMDGVAESLLERTWLEAGRLEKAEQQKQRIEFIYAVIMSFYDALVKNNPGLPIPYDLQPYASLVV